MEPALACHTLHCRREHWNDAGLSAIENISEAFAAGSFCGFTGPNGCGKGLLLNVLGLLEPADSGEIHLSGQRLSSLEDEELRRVRNETFGFLFNSSCLLPSFSIAENVAMPLFRICGGDARAARQRTLEVLDFCGINSLETAMAGRLSPEARRRTALARALVHRPRILIAISPGETDDILHLARCAAKELGVCVLWAGERELLSRYADRLLEMQGGRIVADQCA